MHIRQDVPLRDYSTMRLGGTAKFAADIRQTDDIPQAVAWAAERGLPVIMIGGGSNIIWRDEGFDGLLLVNRLRGFSTEPQDDKTVHATIGAGEQWDDIVAKTVDLGLSGIEHLSLIPGTAGATPVQNVGAYGLDISHSLVQLTAFDSQSGETVVLPAADCHFGYRTSRFKTTDRGRYFITSITLRLRKEDPVPPFYAALQTYLDQHDIRSYTPRAIREAVIAIRQSKLPDPARVANNGSFFANPVISVEQFTSLATRFPDMPHWPLSDGRIKVPAAWLIDQAGYRGIHDAETGMGTWPQQAIVLVNESARSTRQLITFRDKLCAVVQERYGITLEQEPEILPDSP